MEAILILCSSFDWQNIGANVIISWGGLCVLYKTIGKSFVDKWGEKMLERVFLKKNTKIVEEIRRQKEAYIAQLQASLEKKNKKFEIGYEKYRTEITSNCANLHEKLAILYEKAQNLTCNPMNPLLITEETFDKKRSEYIQSHDNIVDAFKKARIILETPLEKQIDAFIASIENYCTEYIILVENKKADVLTASLNQKKETNDMTINLEEITAPKEITRFDYIKESIESAQKELEKILYKLKLLFKPEED